MSITDPDAYSRHEKTEPTKAQFLGLEDEDDLKELLVGLYPETIKMSCLELNRSKGLVRAGEMIKYSRLGSSWTNIEVDDHRIRMKAMRLGQRDDAPQTPDIRGNHQVPEIVGITMKK